MMNDVELSRRDWLSTTGGFGLTAASTALVPIPAWSDDRDQRETNVATKKLVAASASLEQALGRVRLLLDDNQDGSFDSSYVFADKLSTPNHWETHRSTAERVPISSGRGRTAALVTSL